MEPQTLAKLLHVASVGFFSGAVLAMLAVQTLFASAASDAERGGISRVLAFGGRAVVNPLAYLAFASGLLYWFVHNGQFGMSKLMACSPVYVHIMLTCGFLAVGMVQAWKARMRKLDEAVARHASQEELAAHLKKGWVFALLALVFISTAYCVVELRVPNKISPACFKDFHDRD